MSSEIYCDLDTFGTELSALLQRLGVNVEEEIKPAVRKSAQTARKEWRNNANSAFKEMGGEHRYGESITYTVKGTGHETHAEVGSKRYPGLPHLLELGHATVGGGFVSGRKHIEPASKVAFDQFEDDASQSVDRALENL